MEKAYRNLKKTYGDKVFKSSEAPPVQVLSTGIPSLDAALGIGGYARGTVVEVYGKSTLGKSAMSYYTIAECQKQGGYAGYINLESEWDTQSKWAARIAGVDPDKLLVAQPAPGTEAVKLYLEMIESEAFDIVVFDSVGAMSTDNELKTGQSKQAFGQSGLVTHMVKNSLFRAHQTGTIALILNQIRDDTNWRGFVSEKAPGGRTKEFLASQRISLKIGGDQKKGKINGQDVVVMRRIAAKIEKNKLGAPHQKTGWNFWNYESPEGVLGIDIVQNSIDTAFNYGIIDRAGAMYKNDLFPDGKLRGKDEVFAFLKDNPDVRETLRRQVVEHSFAQRGVDIINDQEEDVEDGSE